MINGASVLVVGATSAIGRQVAREMIKRGANVYLAGRDLEEIERIAHDLEVHSNKTVHYGYLEASAYDDHQPFLEKVYSAMGKLDGVYIGIGELGDQLEAESDFEKSRRIIDSNYLGPVSLLTHLSEYMAKRQSGFLVVVSSVAGDRGRQSNYIYGSAKGGLNAFLQGLRQRMYKCNVHVLTVKPGFVDTKMTFGKQGMFLVAAPESVAVSICDALERRRLSIYVPQFWQLIMLIIRSIPEFIFVRLKL